MRKKKNEEDKGADQGWLMTYGDLMSLLLTFFVLLLTFSSIQLDKFNKAMGSLQGALGVLEIDRGEKLVFRDFVCYDSFTKLKKELDQFIDKAGIDELMYTEAVPGKGLRIIINDKILFNSGKARLKKSIYPILTEIGKIARDNEGLNILVEGHTDNIPMHTIKYDSNWELSAARALAVVKFFIDNLSISPKRLLAIGHGEYKPIVPNSSSKNRAINRRVEIYVDFETAE